MSAGRAPTLAPRTPCNPRVDEASHAALVWRGRCKPPLDDGAGSRNPLPWGPLAVMDASTLAIVMWLVLVLGGCAVLFATARLCVLVPHLQPFVHGRIRRLRKRTPAAQRGGRGATV